jgi:hypothetical protein
VLEPVNELHFAVFAVFTFHFQINTDHDPERYLYLSAREEPCLLIQAYPVLPSVGNWGSPCNECSEIRVLLPISLASMLLRHLISAHETISIEHVKALEGSAVRIFPWCLPPFSIPISDFHCLPKRWLHGSSIWSMSIVEATRVEANVRCLRLRGSKNRIKNACMCVILLAVLLIRVVVSDPLRFRLMSELLLGHHSREWLKDDEGSVTFSFSHKNTLTRNFCLIAGAPTSPTKVARSSLL